MKVNLPRFRLFFNCIVFPLSFCFTLEGSPVQRNFQGSQNDTAILQLADPTILLYRDTYYLYGTGGGSTNGFLVYTSSDLKTWKGPSGASGGYALRKGDAYGSKGFWAPQVFHHKKKFYMAYTANENIAIAESESPLGPFRQTNIKAVSGEGKQIDPFVFFDEGGKIWLYHVRLKEGNRLFVARLNNDLSDIIPGTVESVLSATAPWENTENVAWPVAEGPTVLRHKGAYYLFYSANDFRNIDYAVGYATAKHPNGPWEKYTANPVLSRFTVDQHGTGHGDFFTGKDGRLIYVFHTHASDTAVQPRLTALITASFVTRSNKPDSLEFDNKSFRYLYLKDGSSKE